MKKFGNNSSFNKILSDKMLNESDDNSIPGEIGNLERSKNKQGWFENHPSVKLASLATRRKLDLSMRNLSPKIRLMILKAVNPIHGATFSLINSLGQDHDFIRLFVSHPGFQDVALSAIKAFDDSIKMGISGKSKTQQL